jgi:hypothetical protein
MRTLAALSADQKIAVLSAFTCSDPTTSRQPKPDAENKTVVSAKSYRR